MMKTCLTAGAALSALVVSAPAHAAYSEDCSTDNLQAMAPEGTTVAIALREVFADRNAVGPDEVWGCRVMGYVTTQDPGPNKVLFTIALPDTFSGRYIYLGIGGAAGKIPDIPERLLASGHALAGSDAGSGAKSVADFSFKSDPARLTDFLWRGVQSSAEATQAITRAYYKQPEIHRYISGCSGGGQMGLTNARRIGGKNFDGFLVGATPWKQSLYQPNIVRIVSHLQNNPGAWISPALMKKGAEAILARYDEVDGARDGIIQTPESITDFDYGILRKAGFSEAQIGTFDIIRKDVRFPSGGNAGDGVHPGWPISDISGWSRFILGSVPPPWNSTRAESPAAMLARGVPFTHIMADTNIRAVAPARDYWTLRDFAEIQQLTSMRGATAPYDDPMDFSALAQSGAKMIVWHGIDDESMSYKESLSGYRALNARFEDADEWVRYVPVPGLWHCRGGSGPTDIVEKLLGALEDWVEKDEPPRAIEANRYTRENGHERSFLMCAEPLVARLRDGKLDPLKAENWTCKAPE